jgi:hypothetical protein
MDSGFSSFFQQIPAGLILMFCGSGLLLIGVFVYFIVARRRVVPSALPVAAFSGASEGAANDADLPDLDLLVSREPAPADESAPLEPPEPLAPAPTVPAVDGAQAVRLAEGVDVHATEVLTVLRDAADSSLIVQIGDRSYRNPPSLADADFKRRYNAIIRELFLASFGDSLNVTPESGEAPAANTSTATPEELAALGLLEDERVPGDLPKYQWDPLQKPILGRGRKLKFEPVEEISVAEAIEAFLQHKLARAPEFAGRKLHVRSAPGGGLRIEVDGQFFETIDEVSDEAARAFLADAVREWQERQ